MTFSIQSATSLHIMSQLDNLETDIGITYLDNEPLGRVVTVPLIEERYYLVTVENAPLAGRASVTWKEVSELPLCLLTPDMQNRRIINKHMGEAGVSVSPRLESNSMIVLFTHVLTGRWASIMPLDAARSFGFAEIAVVIRSPSRSQPSRRVIAAGSAEPNHAAGRRRLLNTVGSGGLRARQVTKARPPSIENFYQPTNLRY